MKALEPVALAVTVEEVMQSLHLDDADAANIASCITDAQAVVERATRRPMTRRSVEFQARHTGWLRWWVPVAPLASLTSIAWQNDAGAWVDLGLTGVRLEQAFDEPQLVFPQAYFDGVSDGAAVRVIAAVGHEAADLPPQLSRAVKLMVKEWYDAGIAIERPDVPQMSFAVQRLIKQVKYVRPTEYGRY